jgi:glycosyltransferase involved in cell wall biosynthesis
VTKAPAEAPLLTVVVPAYNSESYLEHCLDSLIGSDGVEILVVNDGSKDGTEQLAADYAKSHPQVKVISQPNKGHGGAVNTGIAAAQGDYIKVVDSDDWLDAQALDTLVTAIRAARAAGGGPDLFVTNFLYDRQGATHIHSMQYRGILPGSKQVTWEQAKRFPTGKYLLMHSLTYRTSILRDSGFALPEHTFYVDNIYAFTPLRGVRTLSYIDVDLYHYFIGRPDQSVNESVMISRIEQQLRVNRIMFDVLAQSWNDRALPGALRQYLMHYARIVTCISGIMLLRSGTPEHLAKKDELFADLRQRDAALARDFENALLIRMLNLPGKAGRRIALAGYTLANRKYGFN